MPPPEGPATAPPPGSCDVHPPDDGPDTGLLHIQAAGASAAKQPIAIRKDIRGLAAVFADQVPHVPQLPNCVFKPAWWDGHWVVLKGKGMVHIHIKKLEFSLDNLHWKIAICGDAVHIRWPTAPQVLQILALVGEKEVHWTTNRPGSEKIVWHRKMSKTCASSDVLCVAADVGGKGRLQE